MFRPRKWVSEAVLWPRKPGRAGIYFLRGHSPSGLKSRAGADCIGRTRLGFRMRDGGGRSSAGADGRRPTDGRPAPENPDARRRPYRRRPARERPSMFWGAGQPESPRCFSRPQAYFSANYSYYDLNSRPSSTRRRRERRKDDRYLS